MCPLACVAHLHACLDLYLLLVDLSRNCGVLIILMHLQADNQDTKDASSYIMLLQGFTESLGTTMLPGDLVCHIVSLYSSLSIETGRVAADTVTKLTACELLSSFTDIESRVPV